MVTGITERNKLKQELSGLGYSMSYIDDWQPKTTLYRHKPSYNTDGSLCDEIGSAIHNVPGNPDYVQRKAKIGLFVWEPSDSCKCKWCNERAANAAAPETIKVSCDLCTFEAESTVKQAALNKLKGHIKKLHNQWVMGGVTIDRASHYPNLNGWSQGV